MLHPVRDARGQLLLPEGAVLSESSIAQLVQRGVQTVDIETSESPEEREDRISRETARIDSMIPEGTGSPELVQLRRVLLEVLHG